VAIKLSQLLHREKISVRFFVGLAICVSFTSIRLVFPEDRQPNTVKLTGGFETH
jgi:hypothetical protein